MACQDRVDDTSGCLPFFFSLTARLSFSARLAFSYPFKGHFQPYDYIHDANVLCIAKGDNLGGRYAANRNGKLAMTRKESVVTLWDSMEIAKSTNAAQRDSKFLSDQAVAIEAKRLYLGNGSQWTVKPKQLTAIRILQGDPAKPQTLVWTIATADLCVTLQRFQEGNFDKFWKRLNNFVKHANQGVELAWHHRHETPTTVPRSAPRATTAAKNTRTGTSASLDFFASTGTGPFSPSRSKRRPLQQQQQQKQPLQPPQSNHNKNNRNKGNVLAGMTSPITMPTTTTTTTRQGRVFGRRKPQQTTPSRASALWDQDQQAYTNTTHDDHIFPMAPQPNDDDDRVLIDSNDDDEAFNDQNDNVKVHDDSEDEEQLFDDKPNGKSKRKVFVDSDDDDNDGDETKSSTSKRSNAVSSPQRTNTTPLRNRNPKAKTADAATRKPGQKQLPAAFFRAGQAASSFDPTKRNNNNNSNNMTPIRLHSTTKTPWLAASNAGSFSPAKKRRHDLFGNMFQTPPHNAGGEDANDPIGDFEYGPASMPSRPFATSNNNNNSALDALDRADQDPHQRRLETFALTTSRVRSKKRLRVPHFSTPVKASTEPRRLDAGLFKNDTDSSLLAPKNPWKGLRNLGNTCYLNASVQMLATLANTTRGQSNWWAKLRGKGGPLTRSLLEVIDELSSPPTAASSTVIPRQVKSAMDAITDKFIGYEQRDAHEFLSDLIDSVHEELHPPKNNTNQNDSGDASNVNDQTDVNSTTEQSLEAANPAEDVVDDAKELPTNPAGAHETGTAAMDSRNDAAKTAFATDDFRMTVEVCLKCESCGYSRTKSEMYRHLSLDIMSDDGNKTACIPVSLNQFFQPEIREIRCEKCSEGTHASQSLRILSWYVLVP